MVPIKIYKIQYRKFDRIFLTKDKEIIQKLNTAKFIITYSPTNLKELHTTFME